MPLCAVPTDTLTLRRRSVKLRWMVRVKVATPGARIAVCAPPQPDRVPGALGLIGIGALVAAVISLPGPALAEKPHQTAIELVSKRLEKSVDFDNAEPGQVKSAIDDAVSHANFEIMALGELDSKYRNIGTTIAFVVEAGGVLYAGGIGDSRIYLLRDGNPNRRMRLGGVFS